MLLGYNTNGFAHHNLIEAIQVLAEIGYQSVAITLDHHALNPYSDSYLDDLTAVSRCLRHHKMRSVVRYGRSRRRPILTPWGEYGRVHRYNGDTFIGANDHP